jgi:hypothetical protein
MKAEHRKELQTNILADRMGRLVQRMKERPQKRVLLYVVLGGVLVLGLYIFFRVRSTAALEESDRWSWVEDGFQPEMKALRLEYPQTNPGKAARFQYAWLAVWDVGLKALAADPVDVLKVSGEIDDKPGNLEVAQNILLQLRKDCEGDPIWEPEALYGLAVIEETRAIRPKGRAEHLAAALKMYKNLAENHKDSTRGKLARQRAEALEKRGQQIHDFYDELNTRLDIEKRFAEAKKKARP